MRTNRRKYRQWMRDPIPIPPRATASRWRRIQRQNNLHNNVGEVVAEEQIQTANIGGDDNIAFHSDVVRDESSASSRNSSISSEMTAEIETASSGSNDSDVVSNDSFTSDSQHGDDEIPEYMIGGRKHQHLEEEVYLNASRSKFEIMLMIWNYSFRHCLTAIATEDLCKFVNFILGNNFIPESKYMFRQIFGSLNYSFHFFCSECNAYIKEVLQTERKHAGVLKCPLCHLESSVTNLNDGCFFVTLPVKPQLASLLEATDNILELIQYRWNRSVEEGEVSDIFDGTIYKRLVDFGPLSERLNLSLTFNTDGARLFKGCKNSLWPIHFRLNELPPKYRFSQQNSMLAGLWFGRKEPDMSIFLSSFVKEAADLFQDGLDWRAPSGEHINSKIILFSAVLDSKAKPLVQNMKVHNGYYGCSYCYHPGVFLDGNYRQAKYPLKDNLVMMTDFGMSYTVNSVDRVTKMDKEFRVIDRNDQDHRKDVRIADNLLRENGRIGPGSIDDYNGVKGVSILSQLPFFDCVFGYAIDYMHGVLLGVLKTVTKIWCDAPEIIEYSLKNKQVIIDDRLLRIKPPSSISRRPRSITDQVYWKANEWRSWLLYYSLPCLKGILPSKYLKHHNILVTAAFILLGEKINNADLEQASWYLAEYVLEFQTFYGQQNMYFNVHLLLHLGKMTKMAGPWWCYSQFSFETSNGCLMKLVKGVKGVVGQIAQKYSMCRLVPFVIERYHIRDEVKEFISDLMCYRIATIAQTFNFVTLLGANKDVTLSSEEQRAFVIAGFSPTNSTYERMIKDGIKFHALYYARQGAKSNDCVARLHDGKYIQIARILLLASRHGPENSIYVLARPINIERGSTIVSHSCGAKASHLKLCCALPYGAFTFYKAEDINRKSILIDVGSSIYITDFPNLYEKD